MKKRYLGLIVLLGFGLFSACQNEKQKTEAPEKTENDEAFLDLSDKGLSYDNISFYEVGVEKKLQQRAVPGVAQAAPNYISFVAAPVNGIISSMYVNEGQAVKKGQVLMEIESLEYGQLLSDFLQGNSNLQYQKGRLDRNEELAEKGITSQSEMESIRAEYQLAKSNFIAVRARLLTLGLSDQEIENLKTVEQIEPHLLIRSRIDGVINEHFVELGMPVKAYDNLATVINPKHLLVKAFLSPEDLRYVAVGDSVSIVRQSDNKNGIKSVVASINPALDGNSKSMIANILIRSDGKWPLPGENLRVTLKSEVPEHVLAVPSSAISWLGEDAVVYVAAPEKQVEVRTVEIMSSDENFSFINKGLVAGEKVATNEIFTLKSLVRFNEFAE
jgi:cobalt-zinc-cadmium efflux system membrane fusion protein